MAKIFSCEKNFERRGIERIQLKSEIGVGSTVNGFTHPNLYSFGTSCSKDNQKRTKCYQKLDNSAFA